MQASNGLVTLYACRAFGVRLAFREWFGLAVLNNFAALFLPLALGVSVRAIYLKKKHAFGYTRFVSLMAGYHVILFAVVGCLLIVSVVFLRVTSGLARVFLWSPAVIVCVAGLSLLFPLPAFIRRGRLGDVIDGWDMLRRDRTAVLGIAFSVLLLEVCYALQLGWGFQAIGRALPFWNTVFIGAWLTLIHIVKLTPGNLGILEGFIAGFSVFSGVPFEQGLLAATIVRAFNVVTSALLAPPFASLLGICVLGPNASARNGPDSGQEGSGMSAGSGTGDRPVQTDYSMRYPEVQDPAGRRAKAEKILRILSVSVGDLSRANALDMGCSTGEITAYLAPHVRHILGIDVDQRAIEIARERHEGVEFELRRADASDLPEASFDIIVVNHVYEHVPDPGALFHEVLRLLRPGGHCYFAAGNRLTIMEPHHHLPFLSWLPRPLANTYLRIVRGGGPYYERLLSHRGICQLLQYFDVNELTLTVLRDPDRYALDLPARTRALIRALSPVLPLLHALVPTYLFLLTKREDATVDTVRERV
jgi:SAM-dependent methyltransferase/uncharacterized membrane protein YbhN (UPF0104 family)